MAGLLVMHIFVSTTAQKRKTRTVSVPYLPGPCLPFLCCCTYEDMDQLCNSGAKSEETTELLHFFHFLRLTFTRVFPPSLPFVPRDYNVVHAATFVLFSPFFPSLSSASLSHHIAILNYAWLCNAKTCVSHMHFPWCITILYKAMPCYALSTSPSLPPHPSITPVHFPFPTHCYTIQCMATLCEELLARYCFLCLIPTFLHL